MSNILAQTLTLPCGATIPNRFAKAAMTVGLATARGVPTAELERLYGLWSDGGFARRTVWPTCRTYRC
jgi:2,4-dienoyl-CoA reductase-like NADH-dependent reductase (Old Yellow Enzyme family)